MPKIKLFSGMDFSGKSSTIRAILQEAPSIFRFQKKFLTPIQTLQEMIDRQIWLPLAQFIPLLQQLVEADIANYQEDGPILQDTLWVIKFTARLITEHSNDYQDKIQLLLGYIDQYPEMDSFFVTTTLEERERRFRIRESQGKRISRSDRLLYSVDLFIEIEKNYRKIIFDRFPNTQIIDTTYQLPEEIADSLIHNPLLLCDI